MNNFNQFLGSRQIDVNIDRVAHLFVQKNIDPRWYIRRYLEAIESEDGLICEAWLDNFFKRLSNAWNSFWQDPETQGSPAARFEAAKKALQELIQSVQKTQSTSSNVILKGLEQSLSIFDKVEPYIQQIHGSGSLMQDPNNRLPDDLHQKFEDLMHQRNTVIQQPDSEAKATNLIKNDDELIQFRQGLEDQYQKINPKTQQEQEYKDKIKAFLTRIDTDATFREIENLLDFARRRTQSDLGVSRPQGYEQVVLTFRNIAAKTNDPNQQKSQLLQWYQTLPINHPVKRFIQDDVKENPHLGNEFDLFWKYAQEWINKLPHFLDQR